jgi:hypothetical protein
MARTNESWLLDAMNNSLGIENFKQLCFNIGVNDQNLPG